jgi:hypothetical protein
MHKPTYFQLTATAAIIVFFVVMVMFIYVAIWWQSVIFGEMALVSVIFIIFFVGLLWASVRAETPSEE